jgi:hypothetical protein
MLCFLVTHLHVSEQNAGRIALITLEVSLYIFQLFLTVRLGAVEEGVSTVSMLLIAG